MTIVKAPVPSSSNSLRGPVKLHRLLWIVMVVAVLWWWHTVSGSVNVSTGTASSTTINTTPIGSSGTASFTFTSLKRNNNNKSNSNSKSNTPVNTLHHNTVVYKNLPVSQFTNLTVLRHNDPVYIPGAWDGAPIVLEDYKLLFFTTPKVGCTVWKQLFRRVSGYADWRIQGDHNPTVDHINPKELPHNPFQNGLKYLYHYPVAVADAMLTDPTWTRAIFVRDPVERLLSAYLDKAVGSGGKYVQHHCCPKAPERQRGQRQRPAVPPPKPPSLKQAKMHQLLQCSTPSSPSSRQQQQSGQQQPQQQPQQQSLSLTDFVETVVPACPDPHWQPQSARVSESIWSTINFVGHMEHVETDAAALLQQTGLWDDYGATGWGKGGSDGGSIFHDTRAVHHATDSAHRLTEYYTAALEHMVERLYRSDYQNPLLNLTRGSIVRAGERSSSEADVERV